MTPERKAEMKRLDSREESRDEKNLLQIRKWRRRDLTPEKEAEKKRLDSRE